MKSNKLLIVVVLGVVWSESLCFQASMKRFQRNVILSETRQGTNSSTVISPTTHDLLSSLPPPPASTSNPSDDIFRNLRQQLPVRVQHWMRDSGLLRSIADGLIYAGMPGILKAYPQALPNFLNLSNLGVLRRLIGAEHSGGIPNDTTLQTMPYGDHPMQTVDVLQSPSVEPRGLIVICHGGAWGSGRPWMYRLAATRFLQEGYTVAVWGYRTYPDTDVDGQVQDLSAAVNMLQCRYTNLTTTLVGHSSGTHVAILGLLRNEIPAVNRMIGLAGVYDIPSHYEFEQGRGVDQVSALKPACGHVVEEWRKRSPTCLLRADCVPTRDVPPMLLVHGARDTVVPYTSAVNFHSMLQSQDCTLSILPKVDHAQTIVELMMGGETQDIVLEWLRQQEEGCIE